MIENITKDVGNNNDYRIVDRYPNWDKICQDLKRPDRKCPRPYTEEEWDRVVHMATGFADMKYFESLYQWHYQKPLPDEEREKVIAMFEKRGRKNY